LSSDFGFFDNADVKNVLSSLVEKILFLIEEGDEQQRAREEELMQ